jgi:hypothetical protein
MKVAYASKCVSSQQVQQQVSSNKLPSSITLTQLRTSSGETCVCCAYLELPAEGEVAPAPLVGDGLLVAVGAGAGAAPDGGGDGGGEDDPLHGVRLRARLQHVVRRAHLRLHRRLLQHKPKATPPSENLLVPEHGAEQASRGGEDEAHAAAMPHVKG